MIRTSRGIPAFEQNAVLKLIIAVGSCFAAYKLAYAVMLVAEAPAGKYEQIFTANVALPAINNILQKPWTLLTYGFIHEGFWMLFSNMVWLYTFGSLIQMLVGYRQIIPIYVYATLAGGIFYTIAQWIPGAYFAGYTYMAGAQAGVTGLAVAALTLAPDYKFYLSETMRIPLVLVAIIFFALQLVGANINFNGAPLFMLGGGALMGYLYVALLRGGYKPGGWMYNMLDKVNDTFEPDERAILEKPGRRRNKTISLFKPKPAQGITQAKIDAILDKINQGGYDSLSKEDKETLMKASGKKDS